MRVRRVITFAILVIAATFFGYIISRPVPAQPERRDDGEADPDVARLLTRLTNNVIETGYVESASSVELRSELEEATTILSVVPEGTLVKKGELVVELDSSTLETKLAEQKVKLAISESELGSAEEELSISRELQKVVASADEARLVAAISRQKSYLADDGEFKLRADGLKIEIQLAKERLEIRTKELKRLEGVVAARLDESEIAAARIAVSNARAKIASAEVELRLLEQHEKPHAVATRELEVLQAKSHLIERRGDLGKRVSVATSQLAAVQAALERDHQQLRDIERQIAACRIHAPRDGVVVYANIFARRGGAEFVIEAGAVVRPRQTIIQLPDMSRLQLRVAVNESKIAKVRPGQSVKIHIDAIADVELKGRVTHVNQSAEPASFASAGVKQYAVIVSIIDPPKSVRLGMTSFAEIDVENKLDE